MNRIVLYPYKATSKSCLKLLEFLQEAGVDTTIILRDSKYTPMPNDIVVGWGSGYKPIWSKERIPYWMNIWNKIELAVNKQTTFDILKENGIPIPETTVSKITAAKWLVNGSSVIMRSDLEGKDGSGIVVARKLDELADAELYTRYVERDEEYRVHVLKRKAFWGQERVPIEDRESKYFTKNPNPYVRTSSNGWTLYVYNEKMPNLCKRIAEQAVSSLGLDFGAVDIGWKAATPDKPESVCVYEVNTAPELSDRTCHAYTKELSNLAAKIQF